MAPANDAVDYAFLLSGFMFPVFEIKYTELFGTEEKTKILDFSPVFNVEADFYNVRNLSI